MGGIEEREREREREKGRGERRTWGKESREEGKDTDVELNRSEMCCCEQPSLFSFVSSRTRTQLRALPLVSSFQ